MSLRERLLAAIGDRPLDRVAREAGIHRETLRGVLFERRKSGMMVGTIEAVAKATGVRAAWLAFEDGSMRAEGA